MSSHGRSASRRAPLAQFIVTHCFLMVVWTPDVDSAFRIFSALNNRGLYLSHVDILKAGIVGAVPEAQRAREAYRRRLSSVCGAHTVARSRQRTQWTK